MVANVREQGEESGLRVKVRNAAGCQGSMRGETGATDKSSSSVPEPRIELNACPMERWQETRLSIM
jgi:hypothetical protein